MNVPDRNATHATALTQKPGDKTPGENSRATDKVINKRPVSQPQRSVAQPRN
jgi:hypothetical protein